MAKGNKRKYKQAYYAQAGKKFKGEQLLGPSQKGFLVTCNGNEPQAVKETYNLLNEYADKLHGEIEEVAECDVEDELQKELDSIKNKVETKQFRFRQVRTGARNIVFVRTDTNYSPNDLIHAILKDVEETANPNSRGIARITPVISTCTAKIETIVPEFTKLAQQYLECDNNLKFKILFKQRNSNCLSKEIVIKEVSKIISALNKGHSCQYDDSDVVLNFEVIKSVCCISILRNYLRFRKYNIQEVAKQARIQDTEREVKESADDVEEIGTADTEVSSEPVEYEIDNKQPVDDDDDDDDDDDEEYHADCENLSQVIKPAEDKVTCKTNVREEQSNETHISGTVQSDIDQNLKV